MARTLTDEVNALKSEMRGMVWQQLQTTPGGLSNLAGANASIEVPSNASHLIQAKFTPTDNVGNTMLMAWFSQIGVPENEFGVTADWVECTQIGSSEWRIVTPFISITSDKPWTIGLHVSSLVPGTLVLNDLGAIDNV